MYPPVALRNIDGAREQRLIFPAGYHLYLIDLLAVFPEGPQVLIFIVMKRRLCDRRDKSSWIKLLCQYIYIIVIEVDKSWKSKSIAAGAALTPGQHFQFHLVR